MNFPTIKATREAIEAAPIYGNAYADQNLMNAIHVFVCNPDTPVPDALWALDYMTYDIMGFSKEECPPADIDSLEEYIKEWTV